MRRLRLHVITIATVLCIALAGCAPVSEPEREPKFGGGSLTAADTSSWRIPLQLDGQPVYDPGWVTEPQELDGVFMAARQIDNALEFSAVDSSGRVLWSAERPVSCTGFALARTANGRALAVLSDVSPTSDALTATQATAYDLHTGAQVWGPVDVPGPHQGPGLVYAAPAEEMIGQSGPKTVLDPSTGKVALSEQTDSEARLIGEYSGTVLSVKNHQLQAVDAAEHKLLWRIPSEQIGADPQQLSAAVGRVRDQRFTLLRLTQDNHILLDVAEGRILAHNVRQAQRDAVTGMHVVITENQLQGLDPSGNPQWQLSVNERTSIAGPGDALVFLQTDGAIRTHNVVTGATARGYPNSDAGQIILPVTLAETGAAIVSDQSRYYLVGMPEPAQEPR